MRAYFGSTKNIVIVVAVVLFCLFILVSCGDSPSRDDSFDRQQIQLCLDEGGTPLYEKNFDGWNDVTIVDFIACKK